MNAIQEACWEPICQLEDLVEGSGVCALLGKEQIALFYLPQLPESVYAISNRDPIGNANVLSRGILGDVDGAVVVASPLYKQHFDLKTGRCLEQSDRGVEVYPVRIEDQSVLIKR